MSGLERTFLAVVLCSLALAVTGCPGPSDGGDNPLCTPSCVARACGSDGCGGSCGTCGASQHCDGSFQCVAGACVPSCGGKQCGDDGCGGACGTCTGGQTCNASGQCVASACVPNCSGKQCGSDGCGGSCGTCTGGQTCNTSGLCSGGTATTLTARTVGAYVQDGSTCSSGSTRSGYAMYLCPGARILGGGSIGSITEYFCGSYTTTAKVYQNCSDLLGCYDRVNATVTDWMASSGVVDTQYGYQFTGLYITGTPTRLYLPTQCNDGSQGYIGVALQPFAVTADDCVSARCPAPGGSDGNFGTCGADCDCGRCWYCDKSGGTGTCRYGGEGPYGCYRGCGP